MPGGFVSWWLSIPYVAAEFTRADSVGGAGGRGDDRDEVSCRGVLARSGTNLTIQQPRDFMVLTDE